MNITTVRSDDIYKKMVKSNDKEKDRLFRYELMKPFEFKWQCIGVPLESETPGGYDVIMASSMSGLYLPSQMNEDRLQELEQISDPDLWKRCEASIRATLEGFTEHGITLPVQDYCFTILLSDPKHPMAAMTGDYCGDGGFPGYITGTIIPNEQSMRLLPVALAHETNHNVRWQFQKWNPQISLADMIVSEGLAENQEALMFGEANLGKWATETSPEIMESTIKPLIKEHLSVNDFNQLSSYLYGDEIMALRGGAKLGVPYCAGYACGYQLIKYFLQKTGMSLYKASIMNTADILAEVEEFWECK